MTQPKPQDLVTPSIYKRVSEINFPSAANHPRPPKTPRTVLQLLQLQLHPTSINQQPATPRKMSSRSQTLFDSCLSLARLLTHKIENTNLSPSAFSPFTPTAALNQAIQQQLQAIRRHPLFNPADEGFKHLFTELETLVTGWGLEGGTTEHERARLALIVEDFGGVLRGRENARDTDLNRR